MGDSPVRKEVHTTGDTGGKTGRSCPQAPSRCSFVRWGSRPALLKRVNSLGSRPSRARTRTRCAFNTSLISYPYWRDYPEHPMFPPEVHPRSATDSTTLFLHLGSPIIACSESVVTFSVGFDKMHEYMV